MMQFQSHYNRFLLSLEGTKNIYVSFCKNIISFCAPRTFRFADYTSFLERLILNQKKGHKRKDTKKGDSASTLARNLLFIFFTRIVSKRITLHPWQQSSSQRYEPSYQ